jgi:dopamine beta-monooxygenase
MRCGRLLFARLAAVCVICATTSVTAHKRYQKRIPNGFNVVDAEGVAWPGVGHIYHNGHGKHNQFGEDFKSQRNKWTEALCRMDSDGDGLSNGKELGDPNCKWKRGDTPEFETGITHPGLFTIVAPVENSPTSNSGTITGITGAPLWVSQLYLNCL